MITRLLLSFDRSAPPSEALKVSKLAGEIFASGQKFLVGVDLGGNPTKGRFADFRPALEEARAKGLRTTVHTGELPLEGDQMEIRASECREILDFRPDRIGHAIYLPDDVVKKLEEDPIPIEVCPTSNAMTMSLNFPPDSIEGDNVNRLKSHPRLLHWLETGYPISISTDDSGVFRTNSAGELLLLADSYDFMNEWQITGLIWGSLDHVFESSRRVRSILARDVTMTIKRLTRRLGIETKKRQVANVADIKR